MSTSTARVLLAVLLVAARALGASLPELRDQTGAPFSLASLEGSPTVVSFVYTNCPMPKMCPLTMTLTRQLQQAWLALPAAQRPPLRLVVVTLDPERDTPEVLRTFAAAHHLGDTGVTFVTGAREPMAALLSKFGVAGHPGLVGAGTIDHTPTTLLLGADLTERQRWQGNAWTPAEVLAAVGRERASRALDDSSAHVKTQVVSLTDFTIDRAFTAMSGPTKQSQVHLEVAPDARRVWLKGLAVDVFDRASTPQPLSMLCHAWLTALDAQHRSTSAEAQAGLITISEGMGRFEFPHGFGVPMEPHGELELLAQALNADPMRRDSLSYRFTIRYLEEPASGLATLKALHQRTVATLGPKVEFKDGAICDTSSTPDGRAVHYLVAPGKSQFVNTYPKGFFAAGERLHFIKLHLHRYGRSVSLVDTTTGRAVWTGRATADAHGEIASTESFSSVEGLEVFPDHDYKVVATYDNPTGRNADGMGVLRLYLH